MTGAGGRAVGEGPSCTVARPHLRPAGVARPLTGLTLHFLQRVSVGPQRAPEVP